jgi:hypothetical protein
MITKKTSPAQGQKYKNILGSYFDLDFDKIANQSGFKRRKEKKLNGKNLVLGFMLMSCYGINTFSQWAQEVSWLSGQSVSKQAVCKRITSFFVSFVLLILNEVFAQHIKQVVDKVRVMNQLKKYKNIFVQDSTILHLPECLNKFYPGNYSRGKIKACIRIQIIIELRTNKIVQFKVTNYAKNDQSMSPLILEVAQKRDLIIRDMGYFVMQVFEDMTKASVKFITRVKSGVKIYHPKTGAEIDLVKLFRNKNKIDQWVLVSSKSKLLLRLIAVKMPEDISNQRIKKEKCNRNKRLNHSDAYYKLMRYTIYLTTESESELKVQEVVKIYALRWRIESIFKTWKSELHLQKIIGTSISMSKERAQSIVYLMLIFILTFQLRIYNDIIKILKMKKEKVEISLAKFTKLLGKKLNEILKMSTQELARIVVSSCCYEKRNDRENFIQKIKLS